MWELSKIWLLRAGGHHVDLRFSTKEDPEWLKKVRRQEMRIIADWLKQYYSDEAIDSMMN